MHLDTIYLISVEGSITDVHLIRVQERKFLFHTKLPHPSIQRHCRDVIIHPMGIDRDHLWSQAQCTTGHRGVSSASISITAVVRQLVCLCKWRLRLLIQLQLLGSLTTPTSPLTSPPPHLAAGLCCNIPLSYQGDFLGVPLPFLVITLLSTFIIFLSLSSIQTGSVLDFVFVLMRSWGKFCSVSNYPQSRILSIQNPSLLGSYPESF